MIAKEGVSSSEETKISVAEGDVAFLTYRGYLSPSSEKPTSVPGWSKSVLDLSDAVVRITKERLAGIEGGVAPLNREGVVPMDYLPVEAIEDKLMVSCTQEEFDAIVEAGTVKDDTYYNILEE